MHKHVFALIVIFSNFINCRHFQVKSKEEEYGDDPFQSEEEYKEVDLPVDGEGTDNDLYEVYALTAEVGNNYDDESGGNKNCKTIGGARKGKPCIFPFKYGDKEHHTCTKDGDDDVHEKWCSTKVDGDGVHVSGEWGKCSIGCAGVDYADFEPQYCDTEESGEKCFIPFSLKGFTYHGCVTSDGGKPWCTIKDQDAEKGFRRANCSKSCPRDMLLSSIKLSTEEIIASLKTTPNVVSKMEEGEKCEDALSFEKMKKICSEADYCSPEKKKKNEVLQRVCGSAKTEYRHNKNEEGFPLEYNCKYVCGAAENAIKNQE